MRKVLDIITIVTGILMLGILGGGFFTYRYLTSEGFQKQMMDKVLGGVGDMMPKVLDDSLPRMTGPSLPMPQQPKL
jgi:ABC-type lipoprotein release transport system permease subunit